MEHYGFEVDQAAITIFVCIVPVVIDACVKLWVCSAPSTFWTLKFRFWQELEILKVLPDFLIILLCVTNILIVKYHVHGAVGVHRANYLLFLSVALKVN